MEPMPGTELPPRSVTLVVVGRDGRVLGAAAPFDVATPWWQEVEPVVQRIPGIAVLRILEGEPVPGHIMGGRVTYLVEPLQGAPPSPTASLGPLREWDGTLTADPLRMPWAEPGGPASDLKWAATEIQMTGPPLQHRSWNLSAIWSLPTSEGRVWMKCVPPFFRHEPAVLGLLADQRVPRLIASDSHRMLLAELPGEDGYEASLEARRELIDLLIELQISTVDRIGEFEAVGVPDRRWAALLEAAEAVVMRRAPDDKVLRQLLDGAEERIAAIEECGLPYVLVHGDAHSGNARVGPGADPGIWFDWGDCRIGHPILDVAVLLRPRSEHADELVAHWLDGWKRSLPGTDPHRAWQLVRPLAALGNAVAYQGFLDGIEVTERPYHEGDVLPHLIEAAQLAQAPGHSRPRESPSANQPPLAGEDDETGDGAAQAGDPACWAGLVCPGCGSVVSEGHRHGCRSGNIGPLGAST